jgi:threonine dehydrogenase-like Zn-dependent dehydrogenase
LEAAFQSAAAVMVVPARIARLAGPVVAVAVTPDDPSISAAAGIAVAAKEDLVIVHAHEGKGDDPGVRKLAADTGLAIKHVFTGKASLSDSAACVEALRHVEERLVVMTRGTFAPELALSIASWRRVPVLVIASRLDAPQSQ